MSNKKISELDLVASNASGDQFPLVQNGETMKTTMSKISTYLGTIFTTTAAVAAQITAAITGKEDTANKQNSLTADATKKQIIEFLSLADEYEVNNVVNAWDREGFLFPLIFCCYS